MGLGLPPTINENNLEPYNCSGSLKNDYTQYSQESIKSALTCQNKTLENQILTLQSKIITELTPIVKKEVTKYFEPLLYSIMTMPEKCPGMDSTGFDCYYISTPQTGI